jgi:hypothetical protein
MTIPLIREWDVHFRRRGRGAPKELHTNPRCLSRAPLLGARQERYSAPDSADAPCRDRFANECVLATFLLVRGAPFVKPGQAESRQKSLRKTRWSTTPGRILRLRRRQGTAAAGALARMQRRMRPTVSTG